MSLSILARLSLNFLASGADPDWLTDNSPVGKWCVPTGSNIMPMCYHNYKGRKKLTFTQIVYEECCRMLFTPNELSECLTLMSSFRLSCTFKLRSVCLLFTVFVKTFPPILDSKILISLMLLNIQHVTNLWFFPTFLDHYWSSLQQKTL